MTQRARALELGRELLRRYGVADMDPTVDLLDQVFAGWWGDYTVWEQDCDEAVFAGREEPTCPVMPAREVALGLAWVWLSGVVDHSECVTDDGTLMTSNGPLAPVDVLLQSLPPHDWDGRPVFKSLAAHL